MRITLTNNFHNTQARLNVTPDPFGYAVLSAEQVRRAERKLCGVKGCTCSGSLGTRGHQHDIDTAEPVGESAYDGRYRVHIRGMM